MSKTAVVNRSERNSRPTLTETRVIGIKKLISQANLGMSIATAMDPDVQSAIRFLQDLIGRYYSPQAMKQREKARLATIEWRVNNQKVDVSGKPLKKRR